MLMEVKKELKVCLLSIKYSLVKQMLNKTTFITSILFMILNNASFIIEWIVIFSLKDSIGTYGLKEVLLLWGIAASTYGFSHFFFKSSYDLSDTITNGKLDSFLVQPKDVLLSSITTDVDTSAIGDLLYGYIILFIYGFSIKNFLLFTLFTICGGLILTSFSVILSSLSFWITKADTVADLCNSLMVNFASYPDPIFKGLSKLILYTIVPVGLSTYLPVKVIINFDLNLFLIIIIFTILLVCLSYIIFNKGLKRYSSSNLMMSKI